MSEVKQTWYECPFDEFKVKKIEDLIPHITKRHNITKMWGECPHCVGTSEDRSLECRQIWDENIKALKEKFEFNEII